jgi:hypothetical protein
VIRGAKFDSGSAATSRLFLTREDGSTEQCPVLIFRKLVPVDNTDSTFTVVFEGN